MRTPEICGQRSAMVFSWGNNSSWSVKRPLGIQTRGDTTIPRVPGPTWTPSTALTSEITMSPTRTRPLSESTSRPAASGLSR
jgi:hypothetical protein